MKKVNHLLLYWIPHHRHTHRSEKVYPFTETLNQTLLWLASISTSSAYVKVRKQILYMLLVTTPINDRPPRSEQFALLLSLQMELFLVCLGAIIIFYSVKTAVVTSFTFPPFQFHSIPFLLLFAPEKCYIRHTHSKCNSISTHCANRVGGWVHRNRVTFPHFHRLRLQSGPSLYENYLSHHGDHCLLSLKINSVREGEKKITIFMLQQLYFPNGNSKKGGSRGKEKGGEMITKILF